MYDGGHFIAQTEIQRQIRTEAPVVLNVATDDGLAHLPRGDRIRQARLERGGICAAQEIRYARELPATARVLERGGVV